MGYFGVYNMQQSRFLTVSALISCLIWALLSVPSFAQTRLAPELAEQAELPQYSKTAETLYSISTSELQADGHWQRTAYYSIRINDLAAARDYGRIVIPYNHYYSDMTLDFAHTLNAAGKINSLAKDALQTRVTGGGQDFYSDSSELVFSLPDVAIGTIIEFQFTEKSKILAFPELYADRSVPYWYQNTVAKDKWRADFVHFYQFSFTHPAQTPIYTDINALHAQNPKVVKKDNQITNVWIMEKVPHLEVERNMPSAFKTTPILYLSTIQDWRKLNAWSWQKVKDQFVITPELSGVIKSFNLDPNATRIEKIRAVYDYMQAEVRYVFAHLGRGGYDAHYPNKVIEASYGDCKDQSVLAVALLRGLGIDAYPALVQTPRAGNSRTQLVKLMFDHMVVYIPKTDELDEIWLDNTGDRSLFPGMSNRMVGQNALIVNGVGGELVKIKPDSFVEDTVNMQLDYYLNHDDPQQGIQVNLNVAMQGVFEQHIRSWWKHNAEKDVALKKMVEGIYSRSLDFDVDAQLNHSENLYLPVNIQAKYQFKPSADQSINDSIGASVMQVINLFADFSNLPLPETRHHDYIDKMAYQLNLKVILHGDKNHLPIVYKSPINLESPYLNLIQTGKQVGDNYQIDIQFKFNELALNNAEYKQYYQVVKNLLQQDAWLLSLRVKPDNALNEPYLAQVETFGENSIQAYIEQTKSLIEKGDFLAALEPAQKAIELDNLNGEAWYWLATAQGFSTQIAQSAESFAKASELGYEP